VLFYLFGAIAVIASLLVISQRNPIYSVLLLIASFGALSGLYVLLDAPFVAVIQIIIYAGAIMVLFLFVVMLLNAHEDAETGEHAFVAAPSPARRLGGLLAVLLGAELAFAIALAGGNGVFTVPSVSSVASLGRLLFTEYAFAFEATSLLILVAMVGAVVLARKDSAKRRVDREASQ